VPGGTANLLRILGMMATPGLTVEPLITQRLPYTVVEEAERPKLAGDSGMLGVVFDWSQQARSGKEERKTG